MTVTIHRGDALTVLRTLPSASVQCVVTSPPYFWLRDYGVDGQLGLEKTPAEFIDNLMAVFDEVRRVLRPDGLCFVNIGDSYSGSGKGGYSNTGIIGDHTRRQGFDGDTRYRSSTLAEGRVAANDGYKLADRVKPDADKCPAGIPAKNLLLVPERFAIAMQDRGWIVRSQICWAKTSAMPESVRDRPTSAWEPIWMFSRSRTYYYDAEAVRQGFARRHPPEPNHQFRNGADHLTGQQRNGTSQNGLPTYSTDDKAGANLRNVWLLGPAPSNLAHWASFPPEIPRRCIKAGTSAVGACPKCMKPWVRVVDREAAVFNARAGVAQRLRNAGVQSGGVERVTLGVTQHVRREMLGWRPGCTCPPAPPVPCRVLDPFCGSGTVGLVADRLGRDATLIELSESYAEMARARIANEAGFLADVEVIA